MFICRFNAQCGYDLSSRRAACRFSAPAAILLRRLRETRLTLPAAKCSRTPAAQPFTARSRGLFRAARRSLLADYLLSLAVFHAPAAILLRRLREARLTLLAAGINVISVYFRIRKSVSDCAKAVLSDGDSFSAPARTAPPFYGRAGFRASADVVPLRVPKVFFIYRLRIKNTLKKCGSADTLDFYHALDIII